jgi:hypothetical protein
MQRLCRALIYHADGCYGSGKTTDYSAVTAVVLLRRTLDATEVLVFEVLFLLKTPSERQTILTQTYLLICAYEHPFGRLDSACQALEGAPSSAFYRCTYTCNTYIGLG